jgi:hypothetical protein
VVLDVFPEVNVNDWTTVCTSSHGGEACTHLRSLRRENVLLQYAQWLGLSLGDGGPDVGTDGGWLFGWDADGEQCGDGGIFKDGEQLCKCFIFSLGIVLDDIPDSRVSLIPRAPPFAAVFVFVPSGGNGGSPTEVGI